MCGIIVTVTDFTDHRMVFCCEDCQIRYWRHADRYERRKDIEKGHTVRITKYGEYGWS